GEEVCASCGRLYQISKGEKNRAAPACAAPGIRHEIVVGWFVMNSRTICTLLISLALLIASPAFSQLAEPNAAGAAIGHIHLNASDVDAQKAFWTTVGGKIVTREKIVMAQFPGI